MSGVMAQLPSTNVHSPLPQRLKVRKATPDDAHDIVRVACSVGNSVHDPSLGFLVCNYASDPMRFRDEFARKTLELDHFYVVEGKRVCGFLVAYNRDRWLEYNTRWLEDTYWHPDFDKSHLEKFVYVEKTAVMAGMTGQGIGSMLYERLVQDLRLRGVENMFAETVVAPSPNYASLEFRRKQAYSLVGVRYEKIEGRTYTSLVYLKRLAGASAGSA